MLLLLLLFGNPLLLLLLSGAAMFYGHEAAQGRLLGQIDGMIDPEQTREVIVESLATLATKRRVKRTTKHHGNQPL